LRTFLAVFLAARFFVAAADFAFAGARLDLPEALLADFLA